MIKGQHSAKSIEQIAKLAIIEQRLVKTNSARFIIALDDSPVLVSDILDKQRKANLRCTDGFFFVRYDPEGKEIANRKYPYMIHTHQILGINIRVSGLEHLHKMALVIPEVAWMLRNTNFEDDMFGTAKTHPGMRIPFCFEANRYAKNIIAKMNSLGIDPTINKPLVCFKFAQSVPHITVDEDSFIPPNSKLRYLKALEQDGNK